MLEGKFLWVQGRKKVSFRVKRGFWFIWGLSVVLRGEDGAEFRGSIAVALVFESKFMTVQAL